MKQSWERLSNPEKLVLWAISCKAFFGFFRLGELLLDSPTSFDLKRHLAWRDVAVDDPKIVKTQSNTVQFGNGSDIFFGWTNNDLCPISAVMNFMAVCRDKKGPLFIDSRLCPVTKAHFVTEIRLVLGSLGIPQDHYAGHSFRMGGGGTSAALTGVEDSTIETLGRWARHSMCIMLEQ